MTAVSEHFDLTGAVPFLNVHIERDNQLFLDPSAIRNSSTPGSVPAHKRLITFFDAVVGCALSSSPAEHAVGKALLQELHEPNETRLGMSATSVAGHGVGEGISEMLWQELRINPACQEAALTRVEDLPLFVKGVGPDLVSDLTTRVVFDVLVDFTHQMMATYPTLGSDTVDLKGLAWDTTGLTWTPQVFELPQVHGNALLLVPKDWVFWRSVMTPEAFYNHHATRTVQEERTTATSDGKVSKPLKKTLKDEFPNVRGLNNQQAVHYIRGGVDLVKYYRNEVDAAFEPLDDDELDSRM